MADEPEEDPVAAPEGGEDGARAELPSWTRSRRKRKANVKAEAEEDAFQRGVKQASKGVFGKPQLVLVGLGLAVALIAGVVYFMEGSKKGDAEATRPLAEAAAIGSRGAVVPDPAMLDRVNPPPNPLFDTEESKRAAFEEALSAARGANSKEVAVLGELMAAADALRRGDLTAASQGYDAFLTSAPADHPLRFMALEGKAVTLEADGDLDGALTLFQELAGEPGAFYRDQALAHQGRVLESLDRTDEALELYKAFFSEFPAEEQSMGSRWVRARIKALDPEFANTIPEEPALGGLSQ